MFKWAVFFLVVSLVAGAVGLTGISTVAKRISMTLFALFLLAFLALLAFAWAIGEALSTTRALHLISSFA